MLSLAVNDWIMVGTSLIVTVDKRVLMGIIGTDKVRRGQVVKRDLIAAGWKQIAAETKPDCWERLEGQRTVYASTLEAARSVYENRSV